MLLQGATPERIDRALEEWGMAMGPNAVGDLAGLDIGYRVRARAQDRPTIGAISGSPICWWRWAGWDRKPASGYYLYYQASCTRTPDPQVERLIRAEAQRLGVAQREMTDQEIVDRCIGALIDEGAQLLREGIAASRGRIDVIWCNGYGFPRTRGGPMFYARTLGRRF